MGHDELSADGRDLGQAVAGGAWTVEAVLRVDSLVLCFFEQFKYITSVVW